jgi:hypothetical protein
MKYTIKLLSLFVFVSTATTAQEVTIPENVQLKVAEDYKKTEKLVLESIDYLYNSPVSENEVKRIKLTAFVLEWAGGSPTVTIDITEGISPLKSEDCLLMFIGGWIKHSLENNSKDKVDCAVAAVEYTIKFYEKNVDAIGKQSEMKKLIKRQKKGNLREYIASILE